MMVFDRDLPTSVLSESEETGGGCRRVLLVDDRHDNLVALQAVLEPLGLELLTATSGTEALRTLLDEDVAAILLDVQMPEMDGFETAALLKTRAATRSIPILFLTAVGDSLEHQLRGYEVGGVDYILKPFDPKVLQAKVKSIVEWSNDLRALARLSRLYQESGAALSAVSGAGEAKHAAALVTMTRLVDVEIPATLQAPAAARSAVRKALGDQLATAADTVLLLVSELVTNAVLHARSTATIRLDLGTEVVRVEVQDAGARLPMVTTAEESAESGRGLQMVSQLADRYGWTRLSGGKSVWFEIDLGGGPGG